MNDFETARRQMVDCQIRPNDVTDSNIIQAFSVVRRELFVPQNKKTIAYSDADIALESDSSERFLNQVTPFAKMLEAAEIKTSDVALCVGSGSGYGAAVMSRLVDSVIAVECDEGLVSRSSEILTDLGYDNVAVLHADLKDGCPSEAPFDLILIEGAISDLPAALLDQLSEGGRLVCVMGEGLAAHIVVHSRHGSDISRRFFANVALRSLPGFAKAANFVF